MATYDPPYNVEQIKAHYGPKDIARMLRDPAHRWRAETGIELIHEEPSEAEQRRTHANWLLMSPEQKRISEEKSQALFGKSNEDHFKDLIAKKWSYNPDFVKSRIKALTGLDVGDIRVSVRKHPAVYTNGRSAATEYPDSETGGSYTNQGFVTLNRDMESVMKNYGMDPAKIGVGMFTNRLLAHELAHDVVARIKSNRRDRALKAIAQKGFTTPYLDRISDLAQKQPDKFKDEQIAEYLSDLATSHIEEPNPRKQSLF